MSDRKPFVALSTVSSEYETYYGVVIVRYGTFQTWQALATLIEVAKQKWPEVNSIDAYDDTTQWFETLPWKVIPEDATDQERERIEAARDEVDRSLDGGWITVDPDLLDLDAGQEIRTSAEHVQIDTKDVHFSFYEKHGDHRYSSDWLPLKDIEQHFHGG